jgi:hypothetical protein
MAHFRWSSLPDVLASLCIVASLVLACLGVHQYNQLRQILCPSDVAACIDEAWRWDLVFYCNIGAQALVVMTAYYIARQETPLLNFSKNVDVAARAWKLDRTRVEALIEANHDVFPHGQFIHHLLAYPPTYDGPRTVEHVNAERMKLLEQLEADVARRPHDPVF